MAAILNVSLNKTKPVQEAGGFHFIRLDIYIYIYDKNIVGDNIPENQYMPLYVE